MHQKFLNKFWKESAPARDFILVYMGLWVFLIFHAGYEWWTNPQYGHGIFAPLFCGAILWKRRGEFCGIFPGESHGLGKTGVPRLFFALALLLFPMELLREVMPHVRGIGYGAYLFVVGITFWMFRRLGAFSIPPVVYGVLMIFLSALPWPSVLELEVGQYLMRKTALFTADVLNWSGILAMARGNVIELKNGVLNINEACSGIRSLQSCLMMSVVLGQYFQMRWKQAFLLMGCGVFFAWLGNAIRTLILSFAMVRKGGEGVEGAHDPAGWGILVSVTVVLYLAALYFEKAGRSKILPSPSILGSTPPRWDRLAGFRPVLILGACSILLSHAWFWWHDLTFNPIEKSSFSVHSSPGITLTEVPLDPVALKILMPTKGVMYRGESPRWGEFYIQEFFWAPAPDSYLAFFHRPDVCMPAGGWVKISEVRPIMIPIGGRNTRWHLFRFEKDGRRINQAWGVWRDGEEQWVDFSSGWSGFFGQQAQRWHYILKGKRRASTEIFSVSLDDRMGGEEVLKDLIMRTISWREQP